MTPQQLTAPQVLQIIRRRGGLLAGTFLGIFLVAFVVAVALPPVYRSTATILIEQQDIPPDFVKATVTTYAEQQLQIIHQRIMTTTKLLEIINRFGLYPEMKDTETTEEIVATMRDDIAMEPISVEVVDPKTGRSTIATIAFTLSYAGKNNPQKVQQIANVLTSLFLEENVKVREQQASGISRFIEDEMTKVKDDLRQIDQRLSAYKQAHMQELPELLQVNMQTLNNLERDRELVFERMNHLREREGSLMTELANAPRDLLGADKRRLEELRITLVSLQKRFSDRYPDVIHTRAEIEELERKVSRESKTGAQETTQPDNPTYLSLASQLKSTQAEIGSMDVQLADLEKRMRDYRDRIEKTPNTETGYTQLLSDRNNTQAKYEDLMRKLMEAKVSQGLEREQKGERFTLIEPAGLPERPVKPNRMAIILIGLVLGLGVGAGAAGTREFLDDSVHGAEDLAGMSNHPLLASIPVIPDRHEEQRKKKRRRMYGAGAALAVLAAAGALHFVVMPLDLLWVKILMRFGW